MRTSFLTTILLFSFSLTSLVLAQKPQRVSDPHNMREGEHIEYCITHKKQAELEKDPIFLKAFTRLKLH